MPIKIELENCMGKSEALKIIYNHCEKVFKTVRVDLTLTEFIKDFHKHKGKLLRFDECRDAYFSLLQLKIVENLNNADSYHELEMGDIYFGADVERFDNDIAESIIRKHL